MSDDKLGPTAQQVNLKSIETQIRNCKAIATIGIVYKVPKVYYGVFSNSARKKIKRNVFILNGTFFACNAVTCLQCL